MTDRDSDMAAPSAIAPTDEALREEVAKVICKSRTCEGVNCCQWPANRGRTKCPVQNGGYNDAADDAIAAMRRVSLSAPREDVYRAALEEIASGLSVESPYDIANRALKGTKP